MVVTDQRSLLPSRKNKFCSGRERCEEWVDSMVASASGGTSFPLPFYLVGFIAVTNLSFEGPYCPEDVDMLNLVEDRCGVLSEQGVAHCKWRAVVLSGSVLIETEESSNLELAGV
jgi:hypothetical protein